MKDLQELIPIVKNKIAVTKIYYIKTRYIYKDGREIVSNDTSTFYYGRNNHLIALYEPKEVVKNDSWLNIFGKIGSRLDEIYGGEGKFDEYFEKHEEEISEAYKTIKQIC